MTYPVFSACFIKQNDECHWCSCGDVPGWFADDNYCRCVAANKESSVVYVRSTEDLMADRRQHVFTSRPLTGNDIDDLVRCIALCRKLAPNQKAACLLHLAHHVYVLFPIAANNGINKE